MGTSRLLGSLFVLSSLLAGCSHAGIPADAAVTIDPAFTAEQTETILEASSRWHEATGFKADLHMSVGTGGDMHIHPGTLDWQMGHTDIDGASMTIDLDYVADGAIGDQQPVALELLDTVMHEMGHAFGLAHRDGTLMRADGFGGAEVDSVTAATFASYYP